MVFGTLLRLLVAASTTLALTLLPYPHMMAWNEIKSAFSPLGPG